MKEINYWYFINIIVVLESSIKIYVFEMKLGFEKYIQKVYSCFILFNDNLFIENY